MARKKSPNLTEAELRLMDVIWEKGESTVSEVADALPRELGLAYNTVLTTLRILEEKGYLRHTKPKDSRAFVTRSGGWGGQSLRRAPPAEPLPELAELLDSIFWDEELSARNCAASGRCWRTHPNEHNPRSGFEQLLVAAAVALAVLARSNRRPELTLPRGMPWWAVLPCR